MTMGLTLPVGTARAQMQQRRHAHGLLVWPALSIGTLLVAYADTYAATRPEGDLVHFHLFWAGVLLFTVPACLRLCAVDTARSERLVVLTATALFYSVPKTLRTPSYPLFHDELAHWRQSESVYATGALFQPNPMIGILRDFPGLHALTAALRDLTGLPTFPIGLALPALLHLSALMGVFVIADGLTRSGRVAAIAAFLYSLNPGYLYFDAQYSYESLGIVLFIWTIAAVVGAQAAADDPPMRRAWFAAGLILAAACVVTHHLSSYVLVALLGVSAALAAVRAVHGARGAGDTRTALLTVGFAGAVAAGAGAWTLLVAPDIVRYLAPYPAGGIAELTRLLSHRGGGARSLFAGSATPFYERLCAFLSPPLAAVAAAGGLWTRRRAACARVPSLSVERALVLFGLLYFPAVPFILTQSGNEGARRSWSFTYLGLAVLVAPAIVALLARADRDGSYRGRAARGGVALLLGVVLIGNVSMHTNETYRFPGPYVYGSDTRSLTPELLAAARWFRATQGPNRTIIADRFTGLAFASFADQWTVEPSAGFPAWQLYFAAGHPGPLLLRELGEAHVDYMVVDRRLTRYVPRIGMYFVPGEPEAFTRTAPPPPTLDAYERLPWAIKLYQSAHLEIYRLDLAALDLTWTRRAQSRHPAGRPRQQFRRTPTPLAGVT